MELYWRGIEIQDQAPLQKSKIAALDSPASFSAVAKKHALQIMKLGVSVCRISPPALKKKQKKKNTFETSESPG